MGLLSRTLSSSSGLGGIAGGGPAQNYGTPMAPASSTGSGVLSDLRSARGDVMHGQISIAVIESLLILLTLFYLWTHNVQGGG